MTKLSAAKNNDETQSQPPTTTTTMTPNSKKLIQLPRLWFLLASLRFVLTIIGQRGYIHPDEFFQGSEVISGNIFNSSHLIYEPWEFQLNEDNKPIRNILVPYAFYGLPLYLVKLLSSVNLVRVQANILVLYPRLFMAAASLLVDYSMLKVAELCELDSSSVLIAFGSSYITLVYLTHTFSNSIETILFALLVYFTIKSIKSQYILNEKFLLNKTNKSSSDNYWKLAIRDSHLMQYFNLNFKLNQQQQQQQQQSELNTSGEGGGNKQVKRVCLFDIYKFDSQGAVIGLIIVIGVFNRPTFLIFAVMPLAYWILYGLENCNNLRQAFSFARRRLLALARLALPASCLLVLIDTIYYNKLESLADLIHLFIQNQNHHKNNNRPSKVRLANNRQQQLHQQQHELIITPYNFFVYNSNSTNTNQHGRHPFYQHITVNCFLLFGLNYLLLVVISFKFFSILIRERLLSWSSSSLKIIAMNLYSELINNTFCYFLLSFLFPLLVFTLVSHQEPRFLLPLIVPALLLTSHCLFGGDGGGDNRYASLMRKSWFIFNIACVLVYGYTHQGGLVPSMTYVQKLFVHESNVNMDQHVIFFDTYMPPRHLAMSPFSFKYNTNNNNKLSNQPKKDDGHLSPTPVPERKIHDLMSSGNFYQLEELINEIRANFTSRTRTNNRDLGIFLVTPSFNDFFLPKVEDEEYCLNKFQLKLFKNESSTRQKISFHLQNRFRFHVSFDHMSRHNDAFNCRKPPPTAIGEGTLQQVADNQRTECYLRTCESMGVFTKITNAFSLNFYQIIFKNIS